MNKSKLERKLKRYQTINKIGTVVLFLGAFCVLLGGISKLISDDYFQTFFLMAFVFMWGGLIIGGLTSKHIKNKISKQIAEMVIYQYIYDLVYKPKATKIKNMLNKLHLDLPHYDRIKASDHIKGTYKGKVIEIADIKLIEKQRPKSNVIAYVPIFIGLLIKLESSKSISNPIVISPITSNGRTNIITENDSFNNRFDIYCEDEDDAHFILDTQTTEKILAFEKHFQGRLYLCFSDDGYLYCAINEGRDRFELKTKQKTIDAISNNFNRDMHYVMSIIDELLNILEDEKKP